MYKRKKERIYNMIDLLKDPRFKNFAANYDYSKQASFIENYAHFKNIFHNATQKDMNNNSILDGFDYQEMQAIQHSAFKFYMDMSVDFNSMTDNGLFLITDSYIHSLVENKLLMRELAA